ncbi:hypothetical protein [Gordonia sp. (in: high G+C Gram-positive bacteria)]|uniref:hypothetical protein n=1 Tax=Gordonia sp. (in: high G+C Gram-positive bacteria) TaxID=84139 RepID=UPI003C76A87C
MISLRLPWRGRAMAPPLPAIGDPTLVVTVSSTDETSASSTVLTEAGFTEQVPVVLRMVLSLPESAVDGVVARCAGDDYRVDDSSRSPLGVETVADAGHAVVVLAQVMGVDALSLSRERAWMGSVASRAAGRVLGWAVLQADSSAGPDADTPVTKKRRAR